jgi:cyclomaltodextrinase
VNPTIYYNAWDPSCKTPFGAVPENESIRITFQIEKGFVPRSVCLKLRHDGEDTARAIWLYADGSTPEFTIYRGDFSVAKRGLYFYRFEIEADWGILFVGRNEDACAVIQDFLPEWQLTVYDPDFSVPRQMETGIMYQIFPDRFCRSGKMPLPATKGSRSVHRDWYGRPLFKADVPDYQANDFFGGNLKGIIEKLDYLSSLGVSVIYLNPIFESASNHRYNTGDYKAIDPYLGTEEDFQKLCRQAEKRGIRIILDGVFSHTGSDSRYFNRDGHYPDIGAWQSKDSPYAPWYRFENEERTQYDCWWGFTTLPNVNEEDPTFEQFICGKNGVLDYWMKRGASGWRLDVADELPDGFLEAIRRQVKSHSPNAYLLGEVWEDASNKESYGKRRKYLLGSQLDSVMNYPWREAILDFTAKGDAELFRRRVLSLLDHYPRPAIQCLMNPLSTHDTARACTVLGVSRSVDALEQGNYQPSEEEMARGKQKLRLSSMIQYTLPGFPSLYYGDEAGLCGFSDPWNRRCYPWGREDAELLGFFRHLGQVRRQHPKEMHDPLEFLRAEEGMVAYRRGNVVTVINCADYSQDISFPGKSEVLISEGSVSVKAEENIVSFGPGCGAILQIKEGTHA